MTFHAQIDDLTTALRLTRSRLLAPLDFSQQQLPRDPEVFVEDVLLYVMDEWAQDLRAQGHVLEDDGTRRSDQGQYPSYVLRMAGGGLCMLRFSGEYPRDLRLAISKGFRNGQQFSEARQVEFELPITIDPNVLLISLYEHLRNVTV